MFPKYGPDLRTAVNAYNAGRNLEQESKAWNGRHENDTFVDRQVRRAKADRGITELMGPRPSAPPDVFFMDAQIADSSGNFLLPSVLSKHCASFLHTFVWYSTL